MSPIALTTICKSEAAASRFRVEVAACCARASTEFIFGVQVREVVMELVAVSFPARRSGSSAAAADAFGEIDEVVEDAFFGRIR